MVRKLKRAEPPGAETEPVAASDRELAPITAMMSSRLMVLANLLKRGAVLRYKRLAGLSSVEFGLVASLGIFQLVAFLEVNAPVVVRWFTSGRCDRERSKAQLRWMLERIRVPRARELAQPLYEEAVAVVDRA